MLKTEIEYRKEMLYIRIIGAGSNGEINQLKHKIERISMEYGVRDIYLDLSEAYNIDISMFDDFYQQYFINYSGLTASHHHK